MEYRKGILKTKTKAFVVRVVKLYQYLYPNVAIVLTLHVHF